MALLALARTGVARLVVCRNGRGVSAETRNAGLTGNQDFLLIDVDGRDKPGHAGL